MCSLCRTAIAFVLETVMTAEQTPISHKLDGGQLSVRKRGEGSRKTERDSERQTDTSQLTEILYEHKISPLVTKLTQSKVNYGSDVNKFVQYSVF